MYKKIEDLIISFIEGNISEEDLSCLKNELKKDPNKRKKFYEYIDVWQSTSKAGKTDDYNPEKAWHKLKCEIRNATGRPYESSSYKLAGRIQQIAAAVIITIVAGTLAFYLIKNAGPSGNNKALTEYVIPYGSRSKILLPDGTDIWLNSGSRLKYDRHFGRHNRNISLEGEAYFNVTSGKKLPFIVNTSGLTIKVLGTAFNVKAYPEENFIETTVERGTVQVLGDLKSPAMPNGVVLKANQKLLYTLKDETKKSAGQSDENKTVKQPVSVLKPNTAKLDDNISTKIYTSWKDNRWIIEREELQSLAVKLERRYNVAVVIGDESLKHYVFSGILEDETLEQVLEAIQLTAPILYKINQKQVVLTRNKYFKPN
ncbi:MAG: FecR family protein [Bacteroidales bacterium]|nr:FecR family protein [Bacteroidales bacterium]